MSYIRTDALTRGRLYGNKKLLLGLIARRAEASGAPLVRACACPFLAPKAIVDASGAVPKPFPKSIAAGLGIMWAVPAGARRTLESDRVPRSSADQPGRSDAGS